jgi:hypothetical protein
MASDARGLTIFAERVASFEKGALVSRQMRPALEGWAMFSRVCAAACAALVVGVVAPEQLAARGGAGGAMHAGGFHSMTRSMPRAHSPAAHARQAPIHPVLRAHAFAAAASRHHRAVFGCCVYDGSGYPITGADDGLFYGSYYDPSDFPAWPRVLTHADSSASPVPTAERPEHIVDRGSCRVETVAVSFASGEHGVTIMRC